MHATITLWQKHMAKVLRQAEEAFGTLLQPVLWVLLFGIGMKAMVGLMMPGGDGDYITFMVPGILTLSAMSGAIAGGSTLLYERLDGMIKEYLVAPIPRLSILAANALSTLTKGLAQAVVILIVGVVLGATLRLDPIGWLGGFVLVSMYTLGFAGIALAVASLTDSVGGYHSLIFIFNLPLLFASNALFPLGALDSVPVLKWGALINPTSWVVDGVRQLVFTNAHLLPGEQPLNLLIAFTYVTLFGLVGMALAYLAFRRAIRQ
jgi:ABC-2 type transport system permease protein